MRSYTVKALTPKGNEIIKQQLKERNKLSITQKAFFNSNFRVLETIEDGFLCLEFSGKTDLINKIDVSSFIMELQQPFLEAGCGDNDFKISYFEVG